MEAVAQMYSVKKVFLEILENLQENTCARVSILYEIETLGQVYSCEFCKISKNAFSERTAPVAACGFN